MKATARRALLTVAILLVSIIGVSSLLNRTPAPPAPAKLQTSDASPAARAAIEQSLAKAIADPASPECRGELGKVLLAHQFDAAAAAEFQIASTLAPRDFRWKYLLALAESPFSRSSALQHFTEAAELNPSSWLPPARIAELLLAENRLGEASTQITVARSIAPDEIRPALAEIRLLLLLKQPENARNAAAALAARGIRVRELYELHAQALFQLKQPEAARNLARQLEDEELTAAGWNDPFAAAVLVWSTDPADLLLQARSLAAIGRLTEATRLLQSGANKASTHPDYYPTLSRLLLEDGHATKALEVASTALRHNPTAPSLHLAQGNALFTLGQRPAAADSFRQALLHKPDLSRARFNLAICLLQSNDIAAATTTLAETLHSAPEMTAARLLIAGLLLDQKHLSEASHHLQILKTQLPANDPQLTDLLTRLSQLQTTDQN